MPGVSQLQEQCSGNTGLIALCKPHRGLKARIVTVGAGIWAVMIDALVRFPSEDSCKAVGGG